MNSQLTVADMASLRSLIDTACARGAFKANELTAVGQIYDKLNAFIEMAQQATATQGDQNA